MSEFVKLSYKRALESYKIPKELVQEKLNAFYSTSNGPDTPYQDGPWPLIAFLNDKKYVDKVIVQLSTIHAEFLGLAQFDPFDDGYVNLRGGYLLNLSRLLVEQAEKIASNGKSRFELIDPSSYDDYHLLPPNHPTSFQLHWRLHNFDNDSLIRLITISCGRVYGAFVDPDDNLEFLITFREFSELELDNRQFTPLDDAPSRLVLNHDELLDLVSVFKYAIDYYKNNLPHINF